MVNGPVLSAEGVLYVGSFGNEVVAVDSQTGKLLWEVPTEDWVWASPSLGEDMVYVADISGMLYALDATSGDEIWSLDAGSNITGSPLVHDDIIYIATEGGDVLAVDTTGRRIWTEAIEGRLLSSPVAAEDLILIGIVEAESDAVIVALDLNGVQQWAFTPEN
jgi:outer membrane protein assembly factor BamB